MQLVENNKDREPISRRRVAGSTPILICRNPSASLLAESVSAKGWQVFAPDELQPEFDLAVAIVEVDQSQDLLLRRQFPHALLIVNTDALSQANVSNFDFALSRADSSLFSQIVEHAFNFWRRNIKVNELARDVGRRRHRMHQLNEISLALTHRANEQELLQTILEEARRIAVCEAGSLFLVRPDQLLGESLVFKLAQNDAVDFPFVETRLPMSKDSIAGYVAITGDELNLRDVYELRDDAPYKFNRSFDDKNGYRTESVLALPMRDHRNRVVGVLQFINCLDADRSVIPFDEETAEILRAIASQAAVALQKNTLVNDINQLFESFVQASVKTIEQRDPSTSGHSFRVAQSTVALLEALPKSGLSRFQSMQLTKEHVREVRYAALLHDFGKIGVPESVLLKSNKLSDDRLEVLRYRFELQKERLHRRAVEQELELLHHTHIDIEVARQRVRHQLDKQISVLDQYYDWITRANNPNVLDSGEYGHLNEIRDYAFRELDGTMGSVINDEDLVALSVRRGSLTPAERRSIQAHVVYTKEFLSVLPWPPELSQVPDIAGAHHERIDGSGYPFGLVGEQIPLASRVMAVCDIYDALTSLDRPYKPAMSNERAFDILREEAKGGLIDEDLVQVFVQSGAYDPDKATPTTHVSSSCSAVDSHHHH